MAWKQGNNYGRNNAVVTDALRRAAAADDYKLLRRACDKALRQAAEGSLPHLAWIADRLDGKAVQRIESDSAELKALSLQEVAALILQARSVDATEVSANTHSALVQAEVSAHSADE